MMMKTMDMMDMIMLVVYPGATCRSIRRTRRWRRRRREGATRRLLAAVFRRRTSPSMPWDTPPTLIRPSGRRYGTITPAARRGAALAFFSLLRLILVCACAFRCDIPGPRNERRLACGGRPLSSVWWCWACWSRGGSGAGSESWRRRRRRHIPLEIVCLFFPFGRRPASSFLEDDDADDAAAAAAFSQTLAPGVVVDRVIFFKTHKTGSTTIVNVLDRWAAFHGKKVRCQGADPGEPCPSSQAGGGGGGKHGKSRPNFLGDHKERAMHRKGKQAS